jgi:hypothetical protein
MSGCWTTSLFVRIRFVRWPKWAWFEHWALGPFFSFFWTARCARAQGRARGRSFRMGNDELEAAAQLGCVQARSTRAACACQAERAQRSQPRQAHPSTPWPLRLNPKNARAALPHRIGFGVRRPARALLGAPELWAGRPQSPHGRASPPAARFACLLTPAVVVGLACCSLHPCTPFSLSRSARPLGACGLAAVFEP